MNYRLVKTNDRYELFYDKHLLASIDPLTGALKNLVLRLGDIPALHIYQVFWTMNSNDVFPCKWNPDSFVFELVQRDGADVLLCFAYNRDMTMKSSTELTFSQPDADGCISFDAFQRLEILGDCTHRGFGMTRDGKNYGCLEFTDPYPYHAVGPTEDFSGEWKGLYVYGQECDFSEWRKKYQYLLYDNGGKATAYRLTHCGCPLGYIRTDDNSYLGLMDNNLGAIILRFPNGRSEGIEFSLCTWGYDLHFHILYDKVEPVDDRWIDFHFTAGQKFDAHYRIEYLPPTASKEILARADFPELTPEQLSIYDRPVITGGINRFAYKASPDDMFSFPLDYKNGRWRHDIGYDDCCCVELDGDIEPASLGYKIGSDQFGAPIVPEHEYELSFMAMAIDVSVEIELSIEFYVPIYPGYHSLPKPGNRHIKKLSLAPDGDFSRVCFTVKSPTEYSTVSEMNINVTGGKLLIDNLYFGKR